MSIPRSKSVPCRISETQNSPTNSLIVPPTVRSSNSADSLKPSCPKEVNETRTRGSSSKYARSLTASNLKEFNKRNAIREERRYSPRSPYYQGLTDSSKEINRQKLLAELSTTPGNSLSSSTSKSNLAIKVQEWSASYFVRKSKEERASSSLNVSSGNKNIRDPSSQNAFQGEAVPSIPVNVKESKKHVEINLSETKGYEKHVIVELLNERKHKTSSKSAPRNPDNCKAIILCEADKISTDALLYIKWMIERYEGFCTVFFCCNDITKLQPIQSICKVVHLQKPSDDEIVSVLKFIAKREGIELPDQMAARIASNSKSNLRQAIRSFEATWHLNNTLTENQEIKTGWEDDIAKIAKNIIEEQSPKQLYDVRGKLQNLIEHNVSAEFIFNTMVKELKRNLDDQFHKEIDTLKMKYNSS